MKITKRRERSDTAKAATRAAQSASLAPLQPPAFVQLRPQDAPFWEVIVTARPRDTWTQSDLVTASLLARAQADAQELQQRIDAEGLMLEGKAHPAMDVLDKTTRRILALSRQLMVATIATVGRAQDIHKGATLERQAREAEDDALIPRLKVVA